ALVRDRTGARMASRNSFSHAAPSAMPGSPQAAVVTPRESASVAKRAGLDGAASGLGDRATLATRSSQGRRATARWRSQLAAERMNAGRAPLSAAECASPSLFATTAPRPRLPLVAFAMPADTESRSEAALDYDSGVDFHSPEPEEACSRVGTEAPTADS